MIALEIKGTIQINILRESFSSRRRTINERLSMYQTKIDRKIVVKMSLHKMLDDINLFYFLLSKSTLECIGYMFRIAFIYF